MGNIAAVEAVLFALLGFSVAGYFWLFWPRAREEKPRVITSPPPADWRKEILEELAALEGPVHREHPKESMGRFASLVDRYVRECYGIDSTPLTTTETVALLSREGTGENVEAIRFLLRESDWVKFSQEEQQEEHWQKLFGMFRRLLAASGGGVSVPRS